MQRKTAARQQSTRHDPETTIAALAAWEATPNPETFPYDVVLAELHRRGKHLASRELLAVLDRVRAALPTDDGGVNTQLARFLDTALDKWDGRYDNPSYLALGQLSLPGVDQRRNDPHDAALRRDRLLALLVADVLRFELEAADGATDLLPEMRADPRITAKRCRHGLRALRPVLERRGFDAELESADPVATAREVSVAILRDATPTERRMLRLSAVPVFVLHDEYMFIRVLQSFETAFALIAVQLKAAIAALGRGEAEQAVAAITAAERAMRESAPLFSLVGTMRHEAFLTFREYTDGASAIQSRNYKHLESLSRRPDRERLDSPAYHSVPEVREQVIAGRANLDEALAAAAEVGLLTGEQQATVIEAMRGFEAAVFKWRKTHHSLAVRMLGERRGTGYTEGVDYLEQGLTIPLYKSSCPVDHRAPGPDVHTNRSHRGHRRGTRTGSRCPVH